MALMSLILGPNVVFAKRTDLCPAQDFQATVQRSAMDGQLAQMLGTSCSPLARLMVPAVTKRTDFFNVRTAPDVLQRTAIFVIQIGIVRMEKMKIQINVGSLVRVSGLKVFPYFLVIMEVVSSKNWLAALYISLYVRTTVTWTRSSVVASVTLVSLPSRILIVCRVKLAPRNVSSERLYVMGFQIAQIRTIPTQRRGMNWHVLSTLRLE